MPSRADIVEKIVKILRLARGAGTDAEAHNALLHAQRLMLAHDVSETELSDPAESMAIEEVVADHLGARLPWKEYLAAVIAESFRCAYIISRARSTGATHFVFIGQGADAPIATEAYHTAVSAADQLAARHAATRPDADIARASYLSGFISGLYERFQESSTKNPLLVCTPAAVLAHAQAYTCAHADGGALPTEDADAVKRGYDTGWTFGGDRRALDEPEEK